MESISCVFYHDPSARKYLGLIFILTIFSHPSLDRDEKAAPGGLLCMVFCWRFFTRHIAMKAMRMRTITPSTQPTIRYNMSLLLVGLVAGPTFRPPPGEFGGVLKSLTGYSEAPGTRFTSWNVKENMVSEWMQTLWNGLLSKGGLVGNASQCVYPRYWDDLTTNESQRGLKSLKIRYAKVLVPKFYGNHKSRVLSQTQTAIRLSAQWYL